MAPGRDAQNPSKSGNQKNPTAVEIRDFLLAVVNAEDRGKSRGSRNRFRTMYRDWFPADMKGENAANALRVLLLAYSAPQMWKCRDSVNLEKPQTEFLLHVAILRDRLCYVWAKSSSVNDARHELISLRHDTLEYRKKAYTAQTESEDSWRVRTLEACDWLENNLHRLLICKNPECSESPHFVREEKNQKYCCTPCSERTQELRRSGRLRHSEPKRVLSETAKSSISRAQKRRWREYRAKHR